MLLHWLTTTHTCKQTQHHCRSMLTEVNAQMYGLIIIIFLKEWNNAPSKAFLVICILVWLFSLKFLGIFLDSCFLWRFSCVSRCFLDSCVLWRFCYNTFSTYFWILGPCKGFPRSCVAFSFKFYILLFLAPFSFRAFSSDII